MTATSWKRKYRQKIYYRRQCLQKNYVRFHIFKPLPNPGDHIVDGRISLVTTAMRALVQQREGGVHVSLYDTEVEMIESLMILSGNQPSPCCIYAFHLYEAVWVITFRSLALMGPKLILLLVSKNQRNLEGLRDKGTVANHKEKYSTQKTSKEGLTEISLL
jgi:hypothetical protein